MNPELLRQQNTKTNAEPTIISIGEFLVQENFITPLDRKKALVIEELENSLHAAPFGLILAKTNRLSQNQQEQLQCTPEFQESFSTILISKMLLTQENIDTITTYQGKVSLPTAIRQQGLLDQEVIDEIIFHDLGDLLLKLGKGKKHITADDISYATKISTGLRNFGDICCDLNLITPLDLYYILIKYDKLTKFGDILLRLGYITEESLQQTLSYQKNSPKGLLGDILIAKKLITPEQCQEALSIQANIVFDPLIDFTYDKFCIEALPQIISPRYAEKNLILPIKTENNHLTLALMQPEAINAARELNNVYKHFEIHCVLTTEQRFIDLFAELYREELIIERHEHAPTPKKAEKEFGTETDFMQIELDEDAEQKVDYGYGDQTVETEEIVNYIIKTGIMDGASDIHIEQDRGGVTLRYRVDGVMKIHAPAWLKKHLQENAAAIISRIKVISNLDIAEKRLPQDGVFRICYFDKRANQKHDLDFRVATCPAITGENITVRILDSRKANIGLDMLGHHSLVLAPFKRYLNASAGLILVTGPTGSGKSSTLYGALQFIYDPALKIITAEDPIEYNFKGIMQTQINMKINLTFARLLRSFLRLDPDVILVGEIRDHETATISFDAAQTGHLVLSTLHTNDSVAALSRLMDLEIDRSQIAASLSCVLAQRLVRKTCSSCISDYTPTEKEWNLLFNDYPSHMKFFQGAGCVSCDATGYKGRTLLSEVFTVDDPHVIQQGASITEIKKLAIQNGMQTMLDDGLRKLSSTTLSEICRVLPFDMLDYFRKNQAKPAQTEREFWIEDPAADTVIIQEMHAAYNQMTQKQNQATVPFNHFSQFISTSYADIKRSQDCDLVQFIFAEENGKITIQASPGAWGTKEAGR